ncbi:hypothetical protein Tdes44962_MAKER09564 [Teratosphaeria destructans]|uniref:Uncharacterized protein n=1 Tax=Teratosphaeria destructans TaxID=418781 RepID=A0A9W7W2I9_9PEZI|nr:hypothetical protein Tdes44962_MAKER09564 [Teratosphaeria destructans]
MPNPPTFRLLTSYQLNTLSTLLSLTPNDLPNHSACLHHAPSDPTETAYTSLLRCPNNIESRCIPIIDVIGSALVTSITMANMGLEDAAGTGDYERQVLLGVLVRECRCRAHAASGRGGKKAGGADRGLELCVRQEAGRRLRELVREGRGTEQHVGSFDSNELPVAGGGQDLTDFSNALLAFDVPAAAAAHDAQTNVAPTPAADCRPAQGMDDVFNFDNVDLDPFNVNASLDSFDVNADLDLFNVNADLDPSNTNGESNLFDSNNATLDTNLADPSNAVFDFTHYPLPTPPASSHSQSQISPTSTSSTGTSPTSSIHSIDDDDTFFSFAGAVLEGENAKVGEVEGGRARKKVRVV